MSAEVTTNKPIIDKQIVPHIDRGSVMKMFKENESLKPRLQIIEYSHWPHHSFAQHRIKISDGKHFIEGLLDDNAVSNEHTIDITRYAIIDVTKYTIRTNRHGRWIMVEKLNFVQEYHETIGDPINPIVDYSDDDISIPIPDWIGYVFFFPLLLCVGILETCLMSIYSEQGIC